MTHQRIYGKLLCVLTMMCAILFAGTARAQDISGSINGSVRDAAGAAVPGARVTITNTDRGQVLRTVTTNGAGDFIGAILPIGTYKLTAEAPGFKIETVQAIKLNVNDVLDIHITLTVGSASQTITVNANAVMVNTSDATSAGLIEGTQIRELSLNSRNYEQLVSLQPGVAYGGGDQLYIGLSNPSGQTNVVSFSINGQRNSANNWTLDGADNVDRGSNLTLLAYPSIDAIAEFKTLRGNYSAEFGRSASGQINVVTKSGTNRIHGSAYEFFRNDVLNANSFINKYNLTVPKPRNVLRYNDFGYTVGGPVVIPHIYDGRDKTFFFFSQEIRRVITYAAVVQNGVPTLAERTGNFGTALVCASVNPSTGKCNNSGTTQITNISPTAQAYLKDIYAHVPAPNSTTDAHTLTSTQRNIFDQNQQIVRIDQKFSDKLTGFFRFINDKIPTTEPGGLFSGVGYPGVQTTNTNSPGRTYLGHVTYAMTPSLVLDGGYAYSSGAILSTPVGLISSAQSPDIKPTLPFPSTLGRVPTLTFLGTVNAQLSSFGPFTEYNRNHNIFATVLKTIGQHTVRLGESFNHYQKTENAGGNNAGSFSFTNAGTISGSTAANFQQSFANFLTGFVSNYSQASLDLAPNMKTNQIEVFAQDDWKALPRLTLNLGVRYSYFPQPVDQNHQLTTFDTSLYSAGAAPAIDSTGKICLKSPCAGGATPNPNYNSLNGISINGKNSPYGDKVGKSDKLNFAPRFGFAYDVKGNGTMALRGGYGIAYDSALFGIYEQNIFQNVPFVSAPNIPNTTLDNPAGGQPSVNLNPFVIRGTSPKFSTPYSQQFSLDLQQELAPSMILDVGYFGSVSRHLIGIVDINEVQPGAYVAAGLGTGNPPVINFSNTPTLNQIRPYKGYNAINVIEPWFNSNYNSLQVSFQKHFAGESLVDVNYTFSHALTNNQSDRGTAPQNTYNLNAEYGRSALDRNSILTADFVYQIPFLQSQNGLMGHTLGGWEVSGIVAMNSGLPLTIFTSGLDPGGVGLLGPSAASGRPDQIGDPKSGPGLKTLNKWFNSAAFAPVPKGTYRPGNERRGVVSGPGFQRWDLSLFKNFKLVEGVGLQFRAETTNTFNHTNADVIGTTFGFSTFNKVVNWRDPRIMQLALKLTF